MQDAAQQRPEHPNPVPDAVPHVVSLERVGWRVMHQAPGKAKKEVGSHVDKTGAARLAANTAHEIAGKVGETVELHTQDAKGRPSGTRYCDPPKPEEEEAKK